MAIELETALPQTRIGRLADPATFRRRPVIGAAGDSIADFLMMTASDNNTSSRMSGNSPLFWSLLDHPADVVIDGRSYANGGYNFGVGGSTSAQMVSVQVPQLQARTGDLLFIQTGQNDSILTRAIADASAANVETATNAALGAGWGMVAIIGLPPSNGATGANRAKAVEQFNRRLRNFARATTGAMFLEVTPLVMDPAYAGTDKVPFRGTPNTLGAYSDDGTHYTAEGARAQAPLFTPLLQRLARPRAARMAYRHAYDKTNNPLGSLFGDAGLFIGTTGTYNGSAAGANVATNWSVSDNNGVVVTPSLVTDEDGFIAQRLSFSGTASAAATVTLSLTGTPTFISPAPDVGDYALEAVVKATALAGTSGIELRALMSGTGAATSSLRTAGRLPALTKTMLLATRRPMTTGGGSNWAASLAVTFPSGASPSGSIEISRFGLFLES